MSSLVPLKNMRGGAWETYRTSFTPPSGVQKNGGEIWFKDITGTAEIWIDDQLAGQKKEAAPSELKVKLAASSKPVTLTVIVNSGGLPKAGLSGVVVLVPSSR